MPWKEATHPSSLIRLLLLAGCLWNGISHILVHCTSFTSKLQFSMCPFLINGFCVFPKIFSWTSLVGTRHCLPAFPVLITVVSWKSIFIHFLFFPEMPLWNSRRSSSRSHSSLRTQIMSESRAVSKHCLLPAFYPSQPPPPVSLVLKTLLFL